MKKFHILLGTKLLNCMRDSVEKFAAPSESGGMVVSGKSFRRIVVPSSSHPFG